MIPNHFNAHYFVAFLKKIIDEKGVLLSYIPNPSAQKWLILIILSFVLSFLLTPKFHLIHPEYREGLIAHRDVAANRDFLVVDRFATEQKQTEEVKKLPHVYDYEVDAALSLKENFTKAFSIGGGFYKPLEREKRSAKTGLNKNQMDEILREIETILGVRLNDEEISFFHKYKFSPDILHKIVNTIDAVYRAELFSEYSLPRQEGKKQLIAINVKTKREDLINVSAVRHVKEVRDVLYKKIDSIFIKTDPDIKYAALSLIERILKPNLRLNVTETEKRKQAFLEQMKPVVFLVQKDEIIVRQGEKIDAKAVDILEAFFRMNNEGRFTNIASFIGLFIMITFLSISLYFLLENRQKNTALKNVDLLCLSLIAISQIVVVKFGMFISEAMNRAFPLFAMDAFFYSIPYAMGAMLIAVLINRYVALIFSIFTSLLIPFLFDTGISILWYSFLGSIVASFNIINRKKRSSFFRTGFLLGCVNGGIIIFQGLLAGNIGFIELGFKCFMGMTSALVSVILVIGIIPIFESIFRYTTDIKLLELANLNQPIFQRMIIEAPGTYHHSIIVGSMAEAASEAIGANSLLAKVSGYYHDIGKLNKPQYFIENQHNGENRHDKISPKMSSLVIISHVKDGCELAKNNKLGHEIINIIKEHHGTSLVSYFFNKAKKNDDPSIRALSEADFRYPGPKPQTKEAGLVLLADVLEASSRSLSNPTPSRIKNLVHERIEKILQDGQLDDCELTLHDLNEIADCSTRILNGIFHHRIDYPQTVIHEFSDLKRTQNGHINNKSSEKT